MARDRFIDGWRGVSVTMVIIGHLVGFRFVEHLQTQPFRVLLDHTPNAFELTKNIALRLLSPLPALGVDIFFIISGYLITSLMAKEEKTRGQVSIFAFYVRRMCRILPAFYTYLMIIFAFSAYKIIEVPSESFLWSGAFLCDTGASCTWWLGHTWSLSVEEQFYLAWPVLFIMFKERRGFGLAIILLGLLLISFAFPLALSFAHIAVGALFVLSSRAKQIIMWLGNGRFMVFATIVIFFHPFLASFSIAYNVVNTFRPIMLAAIFFGTIAGTGPFTRLVSITWLQRVGLISYSVYLWQQFSTGRPQIYGDHMMLYVPFLFIVPAAISYFFIEKPIINIGHRLSDFIKGRLKSVDLGAISAARVAPSVEPVHVIESAGPEG